METFVSFFGGFLVNRVIVLDSLESWDGFRVGKQDFLFILNNVKARYGAL